MFAWSQLNFSVIPVSISAVPLTSRQTWQNLNSKRRLQKNPNVQEGKRHQKKGHLAAFVFVPSVFGEQLNFEMISAETSCWEIERKYSQMFNADFYLPLYLPLCAKDKTGLERLGDYIFSPCFLSMQMCVCDARGVRDVSI
jgi:hypothetical protein